MNQSLKNKMTSQTSEERSFRKTVFLHVLRIIWIGIAIGGVLLALTIWIPVDPNIIINLEILIIEIFVGITIAIIIDERSKQSELQVKKTLDNINTTSNQISESVKKIEIIEEEQHKFLENEKSEKKERRDYAYYEFRRQINHIQRYLKNIEEAIEPRVFKSDQEIEQYDHLAKVNAKQVYETINTIRRITEIFRLDIEFSHQIEILRCMTGIEIDCEFILKGSKKISTANVLFTELENLLKILPDPLGKSEKT